MFSAATLYRMVCGVPLQQSVLEESLSKSPFTPTGPTEQHRSGWVPPRGIEHGPLVESIGGHLFVRLRTEVRRVPGHAVKRRADEIAEQIEQQTGRKPGKKQFKELKEQALLELLPMAITSQFDTMAWIDQKAKVLVVDSVTPGKVDDFVTHLVKELDGEASLGLLNTQMSPAAAMSHWLGTGEAPYQFSIDRDCIMKSPDEMKSVVRYSRHALDTDEVKRHIQAGKVATHLALTWRDRVSFILTEAGHLKKLAFLDVVFDAKATGEQEAFDADCAILSGEMGQLIPDLLEALGGEALPMAAPEEAKASKAQSDGPDPLYPDACKIVVANQRASISQIQRELQIGYNRAARLVEQMERAGLIGPEDATGKRQINDLVSMAERQAAEETAA